jgi:hypothetical protein
MVGPADVRTLPPRPHTGSIVRAPPRTAERGRTLIARHDGAAPTGTRRRRRPRGASRARSPPARLHHRTSTGARPSPRGATGSIARGLHHAHHPALLRGPGHPGHRARPHPDGRGVAIGPGGLPRRRLQRTGVLLLLQQQQRRLDLRLPQLAGQLRCEPGHLLRVQGHRQRQGPVHQEQRRLGLEPHERTRAGVLHQRLRRHVPDHRRGLQGQPQRHAQQRQRLAPDVRRVPDPEHQPAPGPDRPGADPHGTDGVRRPRDRPAGR